MTVALQSPTVVSTIDAQYARRRDRATIGVKLNLYDRIDVHGVSLALDGIPSNVVVESLMVGDSYFMTHLGRGSTKLATVEEQAWGLSTMVRLVEDVTSAMRDHNVPSQRYLVADLPDCAADDAQAIAAAERLVAAGADVVKIEVDADSGRLHRLETLVNRSIVVMAHIGYTPQCNNLRRHGDTLAEADAVFAMARRVRDAGASALVVEMVSEPVNRALSRPVSGGLPVYSIFSGRCASGGGQSVNVWDAVYRHPSGRPAFPPTAAYDASQHARVHSPGVVASSVRSLLQLVAEGHFPPTPSSRLSASDATRIARLDPWNADAGSRLRSVR